MREASSTAFCRPAGTPVFLSVLVCSMTDRGLLRDDIVDLESVCLDFGTVVLLPVEEEEEEEVEEEEEEEDVVDVMAVSLEGEDGIDNEFAEEC